MTTFKAAVLFNQNEDLKVIDLTHADPEFGQVKVKMISSGLCGAQLNEISGIKGPDKFLPHLMGHEGYGRVVGIGEGVNCVSKGDYVVLHWRPGAGQNVFGGKYLWNDKLIGSGPVTTFAEYSIVSENRCTVVKPKGDLSILYPLMGCALSTAFGIVNVENDVNSSDEVLVSGGGGLGLAISAILKTKSVENIDIFERSLTKDYLLNMVSKNVMRSANDLPVNKYDYVFETTGDVEVISKCFNALRKGGRLILIGQPRLGSVLALENPLKIFDSIKISASDGGGFVPEVHMQTLIDLVDDNIDAVKLLVTDTISLNEVNIGFEKMRSGSCGRVMIEFDQ